MPEPTPVTTAFVRKHYSRGPTAYRADGSIVRMPTSDDVAYCERQFDAWLAAHDAEVLSVAATAIREALAFESVLPAIATEPRRILTEALRATERSTDA